jgi:hypothetical protein
MKDWAISKGATHYSHVFYPLTGFTAEKHDTSFRPTAKVARSPSSRARLSPRVSPTRRAFPTGASATRRLTRTRYSGRGSGLGRLHPTGRTSVNSLAIRCAVGLVVSPAFQEHTCGHPSQQAKVFGRHTQTRREICIGTRSGIRASLNHGSKLRPPAYARFAREMGAPASILWTRRFSLAYNTVYSDTKAWSRCVTTHAA